MFWSPPTAVLKVLIAKVNGCMRVNILRPLPETEKRSRWGLGIFLPDSRMALGYLMLLHW